MKQANAVKQPARRRKNSMFRQTCGRLVKNPVAMAGLIILVVIVILSVLAPWIAPYKPNEMDYTALKAGPSAKHLLGCDQLGRDILSRILYGGRYSLSLGFASALIGMVVGTIFGCISGYFGGKVDNIIMRICDVWSAIPGMLLAILVSTALGTGFFNTILAMTLGGIPGSIRNTRAMALKESSQEYLEAAKAMNCSKSKIMFKHMMPNIISPKIVGTTGQIGGTIMQASGLSFIGLGVSDLIPEWGSMCANARNYFLDYPHMILWPGIAILITVLAFNLFGDGLRDAMDPKLKD